MIKFLGLASEHKEFHLYGSQKIIFTTYACFIDSKLDDEKHYVAVLDYKPKYYRNKYFLFAEPIWNFIAEERTEKVQKYIEEHLDELNEAYIEYAKDRGCF